MRATSKRPHISHCPTRFLIFDKELIPINPDLTNEYALYQHHCIL